MRGKDDKVAPPIIEMVPMSVPSTYQFPSRYSESQIYEYIRRVFKMSSSYLRSNATEKRV